MEWPARSFGRRLTAVALLIFLLGSTRDAGSMGKGHRRTGVSVSMAAGEEEAAYDMTALYTSGKLPKCPTNATADAKIRRDARGINLNEHRGYEKPHLIMAVPKKYGFTNFVKFAINIFVRAVQKLNDPPRYTLCAFNGTYDELVREVSSGTFHGAVGDMTITADRASIADFTMPYAQSGVSMLLLADNDSKPLIQWIFLKPLTNELWITTVGFFLFTGFVVWMIERPRNPAYQGSSVTQFSTASYFAFSTLTFSHGQHLKIKLPEYMMILQRGNILVDICTNTISLFRFNLTGQIIRSSLSKIVVVIWCFAVLVLVQSYTANLSSMLTAKRLRPSVTDLDQLVRSGDYIGYQTGGFVRSLLINKGVKEDRLKPYNNQTEYAEALRKGSKNGGVSAIVEETPYLSFFRSGEQNKKYEMVTIPYMTPGLGFVFPINWSSPLVHDISIAILNITEGYEGSQIAEKWFSPDVTLTSSGSFIADSAPLTLRSFSGLFVITGCVSAFMLLISIARSAYAKYSTRLRGSESQVAGVNNGGSARLGELSAALNDTGNGSSVPDDQGLHEVRYNDSQSADGSTEVQEAGSVHDSRSDGRVPEVSVQIEMISTSQGVGRVL